MAFNPSQLKSFTHFIQQWQTTQETLLQQLDSILSPLDGFDRNKECEKIIPRVLSHYQQFYQEKTNAASEDVFLLLSPPWLTSFERSLLWVSGFRPSVLFTLLERSVESNKLSRDQVLKIEAAKMETRRKEREITQAMARVQETIAEPPLYDAVKKFGRLVDGERTEFEEAMEGLKRAMRVVVAEADALRCRKADELVGILDPIQGVRFLAAAARFEVRARKWGLEKDAERMSGAHS